MTEKSQYIKIKPGMLWLMMAFLMGSILSATGIEAIFIPEEISLKGYWRFRIGDNEQWSAVKFEDSDWTQIKVPARWEDEGFQGYDGFAWYRTSVVIPLELKNYSLGLRLGYIDDADEVFINGKKIGKSGTFPPHHVTAFNALRTYPIPGDLLNFGGQNLIAVRVYDSHLEGGIVSGDVKIFTDGSIPPFDINLAGEWMFNQGLQYDPGNTKSIQVPGAWENQGYPGYDGYAVYTRKVKVPESLANQRLVLVAGRIDDVDQLYINGRFAGQTGDFKAHHPETRYRELRNYVIPPGLFKAGEENIIEIRVRDTGVDGGVLEGPVGIITQEKFRLYWKMKGK
ncbi:MAG: beta galactosidase jelly roll domain-containing protein [Prolixibacteraceae bacterium]